MSIYEYIVNKKNEINNNRMFSIGRIDALELCEEYIEIHGEEMFKSHIIELINDYTKMIEIAFELNMPICNIYIDTLDELVKIKNMIIPFQDENEFGIT